MKNNLELRFLLKKINQTLNVALLPFKDLSFFQEDLICKVCETGNKYRKNKKQLYKDVNNIIIQQFPIRNFDEINLMLEKYYPFISEKKEVNKYDIYYAYMDILKDFARTLISHRDGNIVYKYWKNQLDDEFLGPYDELKKVQIFYSLSKIISVDLLSNVYLVMNNIRDINQLENFYANINLADMQLDDVLVKGVAENHIHANASFNFNLNWQLIMNEKLKNIDKLICFNCYVDSDFKKSSSAYLKLAIILRILITKYLNDLEYNETLKFDKWIEYVFYKNNNTDLREFIEKIQKEKILSIYETSYFDRILDLIKKNFDINDGDRQKDIIFSILPQYENIKTYGENIFLFKSLSYIQNSLENEDKKSLNLFMDLFLQYTRIKNELYQQMIQSDNIKGLDFFQEYFRRSTCIVKSSILNKKEYYIFMLRTLFQNEYLKKVELRFGIEENCDKFKESVKAILQAYKKVLDEDYFIRGNNVDYPKLGLVYHLIKEKEEWSNEKCWYEYDEEKENTFKEIGFKEIQEKYKKQIKNLVELRNKTPYLSHFILGIDAASLENNTPVQVFAPIYDKARDSSQDPLINTDKNGIPIKNKSLAFTFHAGEDFRHLISGLRRIDEVIEYCKFHSGDRIGHATALGIDINYWSKENNVVMMPRGEYLDNLLWVWGIYTKTQNNNPKVSIYLEQEIYSVAKKVFYNMNGITTPMLYDAYQNRFKEFTIDSKYKLDDNTVDEYIKDMIFCIKSPSNYRMIWNMEKLTYAYNCKCYLKRLNEPIYVAIKEIDIEIMKEVQRDLVKKVSKKGIVVEVNPSSNAAIGEIKDIFSNHAYEINQVDNKKFSNVMININSDDPIVFNTNISNEYAYLYYGLLDKGISKEVTLEWIEKVRRCGMETSFINNKISSSQYYEYLTRVIEELGEEN